MGCQDCIHAKICKMIQYRIRLLTDINTLLEKNDYGQETDPDTFTIDIYCKHYGSKKGGNKKMSECLNAKQLYALPDGTIVKVWYTGTEWLDEQGKVHRAVKVGDKLFDISGYNYIYEVDEKDGLEMAVIKDTYSPIK